MFCSCLRGFPWVLQFPPQYKDLQLRLIGHVKLPLSVRGIARVNKWSYEDREWVAYKLQKLAENWRIGRILRFSKRLLKIESKELR